jgi:hypothetical protein
MTRYREPEKPDVSLGPCRVKHTTSKALLIEQFASTADLEAKTVPPIKEFWVPMSVVSEDSEVWGRNDTGDLIVHAWWAEKQELT